MEELFVPVPAVPESGYTITIGNDFLPKVGTELFAAVSPQRAFVITDRSVQNAGWVERFLPTAPAGRYVIDPPGEQSKHIQTVVEIIETMEKAFLGRDALVIAIGGGTVGDIAGFAAAVFKRGVEVVQIPTTTVAQADSSVGGKTGVDSTISKNAFGAFWQPQAVYIDVATLGTLDDRQYHAGLVESVKHALIADEAYFAFFEENMQAVLDRDAAVLERIAAWNCTIKATVVAEDPTEKNKRRILNYGHTIGHAVESASEYRLLHGEAVAIGIVAAGLIEQKLGRASREQLDRVEALLRRLGAPVAIPAEYQSDQLVDILKRDKKAVGRWPRFVLLERIGAALCREGQWAHEVPRELVEEVLEQMKRRP